MQQAIFFHGNFQNAEFFRLNRKLYKFENELIQLGYTCHFIDGFYKQNRINNNCQNPRNWFNDETSIDEHHQLIKDMLKKYNIKNSQELILVGFSAGALFIDYIVRHNFLNHSNIKCIFCGLNGTVTYNLQIPQVSSFHIIGINDEFVSIKYAKQIYKKWKKRNKYTFVLYHSKKHCFPMNQKIISELVRFIRTNS